MDMEQYCIVKRCEENNKVKKEKQKKARGLNFQMPILITLNQV